MSTKTQLEQIAYNHATAMMLSELGSHENGYSAYLYLCELAEKNEVPNEPLPDDISAWGPFENWNLLEVLNQIDCEADALIPMLESVLTLAYKGIVQSAIDCALDSDMNLLDLKEMVEKGSELEQAETAGGGYAA
ncbi:MULTISPECIES: hypothetical protein [Aeromonas]|uniref:hypothetical protein n=1 Tax=Aeromonas TaxID=642 RepID=UPI000936BC76|nr:MULTISPECIES: hypothetical protein [Aeromonas]ASI25638.1 hypothetical protein CE463_00400 [Aeromonas salmonicida]MBJ7592504.1 hypothetical protein [Aeromonas veronii]OKA81135.1 hypothetical protein BHR42_10275 [Aeromonas salmonicida subsp. salmonicida]OKB08752.1 hypothetical protein BHR48_11285 [Aeromonas salmonicida subsp. salmonicida]HDN9471701.1 hypothetical protein [Aeromonas salmonicida]